MAADNTDNTSSENFHTRAMNSNLRRDLFPQSVQEMHNKLRPPSVTIGLSREEVFAFVSDPTNFGKFMSDIQSVNKVGDKALHFTAMSEKGMKSEFDAEIIANKLNEVFAWRATEGTRDIGAITVESAPAGRGTIVSLKQAHETTLDKLTGFAASLVGKNPQLRAATDLMRLKAYLETGEVPTILGQPNGNDEDKQ